MKKYNSFFIRKNTKELIDKLKKYGFRHNTLDDLKCDFLIYNYGIPKGTWFQNTDRSNKRHVESQIDSLYCHRCQDLKKL